MDGLSRFVGPSKRIELFSSAYEAVALPMSYNGILVSAGVLLTPARSVLHNRDGHKGGNGKEAYAAGAGKGVRTLGLMLTKQLLYQLSYTGKDPYKLRARKADNRHPDKPQPIQHRGVSPSRLFQCRANQWHSPRLHLDLAHPLLDSQTLRLPFQYHLNAFFRCFRSWCCNGNGFSVSIPTM